MRLQSIELSGFKSFADSTRVSFPSQIAGVVGPNGSGKSNIVDAVRWVLGERSAHELRGGQISDVIFNGSGTRKASARARIELRFENARGRIQGTHAQFDEISVAREVTSEGISSYYINNVRARRRDVVDCFLGTGLGPRSYAIIQQGTVSRLVEAKPEELRQHLEEVAGISVYKERRRETARRLENTRENLARVQDTIGELDKQLRTLDRQAKDAEKYRTLTRQRDLLSNQLVVTDWRKLEQQIVRLTDRRSKKCNAKEVLIARQRKGEAALARINTGGDELQRQIEKQQGQYYATQTQIQIGEREIAAVISRQQELAEESRQSNQQRSQLIAQLEEEQNAQQQLRARVASLTDSHKLQQDQSATRQRELQQAEKELSELHNTLHQAQQKAFQSQQELGILRHRIEENTRLLDQAVQQADESAKPDQGIADTNAELEAAAQDLQRRIESLEQGMTALERLLEEKRAERDSLHAGTARKRSAFTTLGNDLHQSNGRMTSLRMLIEGKAKSPGVQITPDLLRQHRLTPMLEQLTVTEGWETAVEHACGDLLRGYLADSTDGLAATATALAQSGIGIGTASDTAPSQPPQGLLNYEQVIQGPVPGWLRHIWFAEDLAAGLAHIDTLNHERIVCKDGSLIARNWVTLGRETQGETLVSLQQQLNETRTRVHQLQQDHAQLEDEIATDDGRLTALQRELDGVEEDLRSNKDALLEARSRLNETCAQQTELQQNEARRSSRHAELIARQATLRDAAAALEDQLEVLHTRDQAAQQAHAEVRDRHGFTDARVKSVRAQVRDHDKATQAAELALKEAQIKLETATGTIETAQRNLDRLQEQLDKHADRAAELQDVSQLRDEMDANVSLLETHQAGLDTLRQQLSDNRHQAKEATGGMEKLGKEITACDAAIHQLDISITESTTRQTGLTEQLAGTDLETAKAETPEDLQPDESRRQLNHADRAIRSLGDVNHAAIKDFAVTTERRESLDRQREEIQQAITTLETAIARIDRETRNLFQQTFDQVNEQLKQIFPDLIGGGSAWLELTGKDLLESGVQIVARPPGKRNATVAMLSGGEKAMTAISLVLALFSLNPAPFCMLDEVDAPLDDRNLVRFATTMKKISERVQCILITHSKITMEHMDSLLGITMNEPGISQVVSVDVESAIQMVV